MVRYYSDVAHEVPKTDKAKAMALKNIKFGKAETERGKVVCPKSRQQDSQS